MASSAGQQLIAGRIPGERIATATATSDSGTSDSSSTEITTMTLSNVPLVEGRIYKVVHVAKYEGATAGNGADVRLYAGTVASGSLIGATVVHIGSTSGVGFPCYIESHYTATATGNQTFSVGMSREYGTGTVNMHAATNNIALLYVDYVEEAS
jgi:hypothetical protein